MNDVFTAKGLNSKPIFHALSAMIIVFRVPVDSRAPSVGEVKGTVGLGVSG